MIRSHRVIRSDQFSLVRKLIRKRLTSVWTGLSFLFLNHRVDRCNKNIMFTCNRALCLICKLNICKSILKSFKTLRTLTVRMLRHTSFPNALNCHILNICLRAFVTPATLWASVTLVTGQTKSMGQSEPDIILMSLVLYGEIVTRVVILFLSNTLTQVNILQLR